MLARSVAGPIEMGRDGAADLMVVAVSIESHVGGPVLEFLSHIASQYRTALTSEMKTHDRDLCY